VEQNHGSGGVGGGDDEITLAGFPELLYVPDLAGLLRISEGALRQRAARGQVPAPFKLGKALAWTRGSVASWLRDCGRSTRPTAMKITLRPYINDKARWHVDLRLMHPNFTEHEIRRRLVAPSGLSEAQARAWGERQMHVILREVLGCATRPEPSAARTRHKEAVTAPMTYDTTTRGRAATPLSYSPMRRSPVRSPEPKPRAEPTLAEFYEHRFDPEHLALLKPATQENYAVNFRLHIGPQLGGLPLSAINEDRLSGFRAGLRRGLGVRTVNLVLSQLTKILRFAKKVRALEALPDVEKLPTPRRQPKDVYSASEIAALLRTAAALDETWVLILLLALDAGLRASEICALEWRDVDLQAGMMTIQHNVYRGQRQTPKGTIGRVAMSSALRAAMEEHRRRERIGALVLYRRNYKTDHEWLPHTRHSLTQLLNRIQREAGLRRSGMHLLRHTALTRLSELGASVYVIQAVARHSDLQTTQAYIHTQQATQTRAAAHLLDQAAASVGEGKSLATPAKDPNT
jgi:integrase/predicted DNA-binding transcriptional regulator AlpA